MIAVSLHGFTGSPKAWQQVLPSLGLEILGHHSSLPAKGGSFAAEVQRLAGRIAELDAAPVHLLGYSMGARLALGVAGEHPELIGRLTLIGVHPGLEDSEARRARREADERWCQLLETGGIEAFVDAWEALPLWDSQRGLSPASLAAQRQTRMSHDPLELAGALRALGLGVMPNLWPVLAGLPMPVDFVAGARDEKFCRLAQRGAALAPRGRALSIPRAGHNPLLERPAALVRALAGAGSEDPRHLRRQP